MAPPLRLCGVQRRARPLAFRIGSPISWSTVLLIPTPPQSAAFARGFSHSDPACQRYRRTCPPTSRPAEACAATQDGSQTLDGQEHAVAREAGGVAPRVSTQPSALRLSTVRPLRRLTAPPNIARRSSRSHMTQPGKSGHSGGVSSAQISLNIPPRPSSTTSAHTAR
ncbi:hypothetical protein BJV77DRAFT_1028671, partial [Russula vinacea]